MRGALWRTVYTSGHDLAAVTETDSGWRLEGTAIYLKEAEPASIRYALDLGSDWATISGSFEGLVGPRPLRRFITRDARGWKLDGVRQKDMEGILDLDFGFTPATNHPQLRRMALEIGESAQINVAWMDVDSNKLEILPQIYRRISETSYAYESPQGPYRATLEIASNGFISIYPGLWEMEQPLG